MMSKFTEGQKVLYASPFGDVPATTNSNVNPGGVIHLEVDGTPLHGWVKTSDLKPAPVVEPPGFAAIVKDANGQMYTHADPGHLRAWFGTCWVTWDEIESPEILFEGVK